MAKKKTQFNKAKFNKKSGVLSYNYLGGEAGKGRGAVSIVKQDGDWFFADSSGKIRTDVGINGKLTPTHMNNLKRDGIFAAAKINDKGEKLSKAEIKVAKAEIKAGPEGGYSSKAGDSVGIDSSGNVSDGSASPINLEKSNYSLPEMSAPASQASTDFTPVTGDPTARRSAITENAPPTLQSGFGRGRDFDNKMIGSGYAEYDYIPPEVSLPETANAPGVANSSGYGNYTYPGGEGTGEFTTSNYRDAGQMSLGNQSGSIGSAPSFGSAPSQSFVADPNSMGGPVYSSPGVDQKNLTIGESGFIDDSFYNKDGQIMKDSGWFGGDDTVATQADIDAGIKNQASPGMTSAEGWQAAGSVMKGVGGLASAYTGIKNYQLARDAHNTQKNQWQANYNQRLKAYEDNKTMANQEIDARNRVLKARGVAEADRIQHI